ncbi:MAG TPA: hypothetical protein VFZ59_11000 [Verrucomicrobiae bacterium]|nr:hypothetical protein [Verrucomicrobiae bacterium]
MKFPVVRLAFIPLLCLFLGCGCGKPSGKVLGKAPQGKPDNVLSVKGGITAPQVVLQGVMIEKCPTAGCWFRLRDGTGVIKVDTKLAGFVVVDVPLESKVTVAGKVIADGDDVQIEATGIQY